nr:acetylcholine receptor subunit beta-like [Crassostrea gigas]
MSSVAYFTFIWNDTRLNWSSSASYSDIEAIYSTESVLFIPPIVVENSVSNLGLISDKTLPIKIAQNGEITWSPGNIYDTSCDIDATFYPFDVQTCSIILTTRGYTSNQLSLSLNDVPVILTSYQENGEWTYIRSNASASVVLHGSEVYSQVNFSFTFERRTPFHLLSTILPLFFLVSMTCFVFKIPVDAGEKLGYCLTVLLAFAVYLTLVSDNIPTTSTSTSYLSVFLNLMLAIGVSAVFLIILVIHTHFKSEDEEISNFTENISIFVAKMVCLRHYTCCRSTDNSSVGVVSLQEKGGNFNDIHVDPIRNRLKWQDVAKILDALFFRVYLWLIIIMIIIYAVIMATCDSN